MCSRVGSIVLDLVVEAIVENMAIKVPFYEDLGKIVKPSAIFASNTSSLPITQMALASRRPDRFGKKKYLTLIFDALFATQ
jgi:3-hydroxyacyl-CoA dehydrogenase